jgi:hypothetical protein
VLIAATMSWVRTDGSRCRPQAVWYVRTEHAVGPLSSGTLTYLGLSSGRSRWSRVIHASPSRFSQRDKHMHLSSKPHTPKHKSCKLTRWREEIIYGTCRPWRRRLNPLTNNLTRTAHRSPPVGYASPPPVAAATAVPPGLRAGNCAVPQSLQQLALEVAA